jgi:hypothetical protein
MYRTHAILPVVKRRGAALAIGVAVAVVYVGTLGMLPNFGEVAGPAFVTALLGLWALGTVTLGRRRS